MNLIWLVVAGVAFLTIVQSYLVCVTLKRYKKYLRDLAVNTANLAKNQNKQVLLLGSLAERVTTLEPKEESEG